MVKRFSKIISVFLVLCFLMFYFATIALAATTTKTAKFVISPDRTIESGIQTNEVVNFIIAVDSVGIDKAKVQYQVNLINSPGEIQQVLDPSLAAQNKYSFNFKSDIPSGIIIKLECSITYIDGEVLKLSKYIRFEVLMNEKPLLSFGAISDIHIGLPSQSLRFENALENYKRLMPDYDVLCLVGDITDTGSLKEYKEANRIIDDKKIDRSKIFYSIGNHEFYESGSSTVKTPIAKDIDYVNRFVNEFNIEGGKVYSSRIVNGYNFITIGSEYSRITDKNYGDNLIMSEQQFVWLEQQLDLAAKRDSTKPIFLMCHQPLSNTVYGSGYKNEERDTRLKQIISKYPQIVFFSGHSHRTLEHFNSIYDDNLIYVNTAGLYTLAYGNVKMTGSYQSVFTNVYKDRIVIKGYDHSRKEWVNIKTFALPYAKVQKSPQPPVFNNNGNFEMTDNISVFGQFSFEYPESINDLNRFEIYLNGKWIKTEHYNFWDEIRDNKVSFLLNSLTPGAQNEVKVNAYDVYNNISNAISLNFVSNTKTGFNAINNNVYYVYPKTYNIAKGFNTISNKIYYFDTNGILQTGWLKIDGKRYYANDKGEIQIGAKEIDGQKYYFDNTGVMKTGFVTLNGKKYYYDSQGRQKTGWVTVKDKKYYLDLKTGEAYIDWKIIDGTKYFFNSVGELSTGFIKDKKGDVYYLTDTFQTLSGWYEILGKKYYFLDDGRAMIGWANIDGLPQYFNNDGSMAIGLTKCTGDKWYYFNSDGFITTGWIKDKSKTYYFNKDGTMKIGWLKENGNSYYFNKDGSLRAGWLKLGNKSYYFNKDGIMKTGWLKEKGKSYYFNKDGTMKTGWLKENGKTYYFDKDGAMKTGWLKLSNKKYYFDTKGVMKKGWLKLSGKKYYLKNDGVMQIGRAKINGKWYTFKSDGSLK